MKHAFWPKMVIIFFFFLVGGGKICILHTHWKHLNEMLSICIHNTFSLKIKKNSYLDICLMYCYNADDFFFKKSK